MPDDRHRMEQPDPGLAARMAREEATRACGKPAVWPVGSTSSERRPCALPEGHSGECIGDGDYTASAELAALLSPPEARSYGAAAEYLLGACGALRGAQSLMSMAADSYPNQNEIDREVMGRLEVMSRRQSESIAYLEACQRLVQTLAERTT